MVICVIHDSDSLGGSSLSMIDIIKMLNDNHEVIVCIPQSAKKLKTRLAEEHIKTYEVKNTIPRFSYYSGSAMLFTRTVIKQILSYRHEIRFIAEIETHKPDIIIFNSVVTSLSGRKFSKRIKKICFVRETFKQTVIDIIFRSVLENHFNGVCYIAEHERQYMNLIKPLTQVIPDCLEPLKIDIMDRDTACSIENLERGNSYFLFLGGLDPIKGSDFILKAMCSLDSDYILIVAGYFDLKKMKLSSVLKYCYNPIQMIYLLRTRFYYNKLNQQGRVICTGFRNNISSLMCCCDAVVFPSRHPHQPRPAIEAGEFRKTVILPDYEATTEFFINDFNALTFKPRNAKDLARKIRMLRDDEQMKNRLAEANYRMTRKLHNYADIQNRLRHFLYRCVETDITASK